MVCSEGQLMPSSYAMRHALTYASPPLTGCVYVRYTVCITQRQGDKQMRKTHKLLDDTSGPALCNATHRAGRERRTEGAAPGTKITCLKCIASNGGNDNA